MKRYQQGFILLMTLLVIAVISLLVLTSMQHILVYYKAINQQEAVHQSFYQLEEVALQLAKSSFVSAEQACVIHKDSANQVIEKLIHHQGCSLKRGRSAYQYLIEELGDFPCLVAYQKGQMHSTNHHRVSVLRMEEGRPVSLLQIRFIAAGSVLKCLRQAHSITLGVSSWRYFASVDSLN